MDPPRRVELGEALGESMGDQHAGNLVGMKAGLDDHAGARARRPKPMDDERRVRAGRSANGYLEGALWHRIDKARNMAMRVYGSSSPAARMDPSDRFFGSIAPVAGAGGGPGDRPRRRALPHKNNICNSRMRDLRLCQAKAKSL